MSLNNIRIRPTRRDRYFFRLRKVIKIDFCVLALKRHFRQSMIWRRQTGRGNQNQGGRTMYKGRYRPSDARWVRGQPIFGP